MKKSIVVLLLILITTVASYAQRGGGRPMERIHAAKMAYITDRIHLTAAQSADFIPLYNEYEQELKSIRKAYRQKFPKDEKGPEDDIAAKKFIDDNLDYQQDVIQLKRKYNDRFLKIISATQLADMNQAEREFKQLLMQRMKERRDDNRSGGGRWR